MGAGVSFVAASDYAVAASDARFGCAWIKVGLMPDVGGIWSIPRKVGHRKAMELCALGDTFDANEALRLQLVNKLCEPGRALEEALGDSLEHVDPMDMFIFGAQFVERNRVGERGELDEDCVPHWLARRSSVLGRVG